jgi:hypothetical protein
MRQSAQAKLLVRLRTPARRSLPAPQIIAESSDDQTANQFVAFLLNPQKNYPERNRRSLCGANLKITVNAPNCLALSDPIFPVR